MQQDPKVHEIQMVEVSKIKFDDTNPNKMTDTQLDALWLNMINDKVGNTRPVILNKDFSIIDGEHRVKAYQKHGIEKIPCIILHLSKTQAKMQRQIQNKLHGEHDFEKDKLDFAIIKNDGLLKEFAESLGKKEDDFLKILEGENGNKKTVSFEANEKKCPSCGAVLS